MCQGLLTRKRTTIDGVEISVIDFMIVCVELFHYMTEMTVDEVKKYSVESYRKVGNKVKITPTDHNMLIGKFNIKIQKNIVKSRREIFNYNDEEGKQIFKKLTSENALSKCFEEQDILKASEKWLKELNNILHRSFKKIKVGNKGKKDNLTVEKIKEKHKLKNELESLKVDIENDETVAKESVKKKHNLEDKIESIEGELAQSNAEKHSNLIKEHFEELTGDSGEMSVSKMWNLKKRLSPQNSEVPMAMQDKAGNLISGIGGLRNLYQTTYEERLSHKPIKEGWENIQILKENLFEYRLQLSSEIKSEDWDFHKVLKICTKLKAGKARDRHDFIYELFKPDVAGDDLILSLMHMFNGIKSSRSIPNFLQKMAITSLFKSKGVKSDFSNQRGIFNVSKVRSIMDKMLYHDVYDTIDENLSYSNIGGRKGRNIRDHLFVVYAIINDVINGSSPPVDMQSIDIHKCFDEMWYEETHNDMFDVKVQDDKFALIAKMDETAEVVVKTPCGPTDEFTLQKIVMQGSVFGPIKSTIQIDTLGRDCQNQNQGKFLYKNVLGIILKKSYSAI